MTTKEKNNYKKILSSCIVLSMLLTGFATMFIVGGPVETVKADPIAIESLPSIRVYGEEDSSYPTHSYFNNVDFYYRDETDVFDPGVIVKDSITFNPALLETDIVCDTSLDEKIFHRMFYEPEYGHSGDIVMNRDDNENWYCEKFNAIVTETSYMFVTDDTRDPAMVHAGTLGQTIVLPYDSSDAKPGMDVAGDVVLTRAYADSELTKGSIIIEKSFELDEIDSTASFMDHSAEFFNINDNGASVDMILRYLGNDDGSHAAEQPGNNLEIGKYYFFSRNHQVEVCDNVWGCDDPEYRWYMYIDDLNGCSGPSCYESADVVLGRRLTAGETFYVDGVRYDMPAIYVKEVGNGIEDEFKFITFQSPIPKGDTVGDVEDDSHVADQYLTRLPKYENMWVLYPFDEDHWMIDDIGLPKCLSECTLNILKPGLKLSEKVGALEYSWIDQDIEERFNSSLFERLETIYDCGEKISDPGNDECDTEEIWEWFGVNTKPNRYTLFELPNQETPNDSYSRPGFSMSPDGFEYLLTSSFIAPNSDDLSDDNCYRHDIVDRVYAAVSQYKDYERMDYSGDSRVVFEYDAEDDMDIYVDFYNQALRVYGEEDSSYPTHSYFNNVDFYYRDETDVFDPGVIVKDSITFNPALLETDIVCDTSLDEKIFHRMFYEPEYGHSGDIVMNRDDNENWYCEKFNAIVTETSYMFVTDDTRDPAMVHAGTLGQTIVLPYDSSDAKPGMDVAGDVVLTRAYADSELTKGSIIIEKSFELDEIDSTASFMDHSAEFFNINDNGASVDMILRYLGNDDGSHAAEQPGNNLEIGKYYFFSRNHQVEVCDNVWGCDDPEYRWYMYIDDLNGCSGPSCYESADVVLGRRLTAGETFYVDGVRYDMPAIYVKEVGNGIEDEFKFITFQSPIPKGDTVGDVEDDSHVADQYLTRLPKYENMWVLYPFDEDHWMIDDIGLPKCLSECTLNILKPGLKLSEKVGALEYSWIDQDFEERFNSSLFERLDTLSDGSEEWKWFGVNTKPNQYTLFDLPNQEVKGAAYIDSFYTADGFEYLLTSSFIAPNSDELSGNNCYRHDIVDCVYTAVSQYKDYERMDYSGDSRVAFEHDAADFTGIYIEEKQQTDNTCPEANDDSSTTKQNTPKNIYVLSNDEDDDGDTLTIDSIIQGSHGTVTNYNTYVKYSPDETFTGVDTFTYTITDGECTDTATVTVSVNSCNGDCDGPIADWSCDATPQGNGYIADVGQAITFDAGESFDQDENGAYITNYRWDWDDSDGVDDWVNDGEEKPTHSYTSSGTYYVTVEVTDDEGDKDVFPDGSVTEQKIPIVIEDIDTCQFYVHDVVIPACGGCLGNTNTGDIQITDVTNAGSFLVTIEWSNDDVHIVDVDVASGDYPSAQYTWNNDTTTGTGKLTISSNSNPTGTGPDLTIATLTYEGITDDGTDVTITRTSLYEAGSAGTKIPHGIRNGKVTVGGFDPADMNCDGEVTIYDAYYLQMHVNNGYPQTGEWSLCSSADPDVYNDGTLDIYDAYYLQMHVNNGYPQTGEWKLYPL